MSRSYFLHAGHKKDLFIADLVSERPEFIESFPFALITSLDSSPPSSLTNVRRALNEHVDEFWEVGSGVLLSGQQTISLAGEDFFFSPLHEGGAFFVGPP